MKIYVLNFLTLVWYGSMVLFEQVNCAAAGHAKKTIMIVGPSGLLTILCTFTNKSQPCKIATASQTEEEKSKQVKNC